MVLNKDKNLKIYYSIKEVAQMLGVAESTLRFWESEFPQIKPKTARGTGIRQYTEKDIEQLKVIYNLVKVRGFKIAAARKMAEITWALLTEKQDFDAKKMMGKYKPMNLAGQALAAINK